MKWIKDVSKYEASNGDLNFRILKGGRKYLVLHQTKTDSITQWQSIGEFDTLIVAKAVAENYQWVQPCAQ